MASAKAIQGLKHVKPIFSTDKNQARQRVLALYRGWYRHLPKMCEDYHIDIHSKDAKVQLRKEFMKNSHVTDIRVIDVLCIKGQQDLMETKNVWRMSSHVMAYFNQTINPKPTDFLSKFYDGHQP